MAARPAARGTSFAASVAARSRGDRGFTFIELLIAATMISVMFVGLNAHLRGGVMVWRQTTERAETLQRRRVGLDRLQQDLANAVVYDERAESYGDEAGRLPWPVFDDNSIAWYTVVPQGTDPARVRYVTYACEEVDDQPGLWRRSRTVAQARARLDAPGQLVLPGCEELALQYAMLSPSPTDPLSWEHSWMTAEQPRLPRLVRVTVRLASGERLERVLMVPAGVLVEPEL
jgi:prepilin-type N-terminal cleavage/methylation domain-containing protein